MKSYSLSQKQLRVSRVRVTAWVRSRLIILVCESDLAFTSVRI